MRHLKRLLIIVGFALAAAPAFSATTTASLTVFAVVAGACGVTTIPVSFGTLPNAIASNIDAQGEVRVTCASGTPYTVGANLGLGAGATFAARRMRGGGTATLTYGLYTSAARTTVWGDGTSGSSLFNNTANGTTQVMPVFGRIPAGQNVMSGTYSDSVTVTVTF